MDRSSEFLSVAVLNAVALVGLVVAAVWADDGTTLAEQTSPLSLGVAAVTIGAVGNALFLLAQRRRITSKLDDLLTPTEGEDE